MQKSIVIIGGGVMGQTIASAISGSEFSVDILGRESSRESIKSADILIIAVKPQSFADLAKEINQIIRSKTIVVSIMGGVTIKSLQKSLGVEKIVRSMPNLGARFNESMTVWSSLGLNEKENKLVANIFGLFGKEMYFEKEEFIDKATAISGCGPGFFAYIIDSYIQASIAQGFSSEQSRVLVLQMLKATNQLIQDSDTTPADIAVQVASKGGITEAGLKVLAKKKFASIFKEVMKTSYKKSKELAKSF